MTAYELYKIWQENGASKDDPVLMDLKYSSENLPIPYSKIEQFVETLKNTYNMWYDPVLPFTVEPDGSIIISVTKEEDSAESELLDPEHDRRVAPGEEVRTCWGGEGPLARAVCDAEYKGEERCWDIEDILESVVSPNEEGVTWSTSYSQEADYDGNTIHCDGWYEKDTGCGEPSGYFYVDRITAWFTKTWKITISK